jgi:polyisoprenoid-binding protein YceI
MGKYLRLLVLVLMSHYTCSAQIYEVQRGYVRFFSQAKQELIKASTDALKGVVDLKKKTFVFKVGNASFQGFNSPLQQEHFNENYMETDLFPESYFTGKIIEDVDFTKPGEYKVRAKGKLKIHGIEQERIIEVKVKSTTTNLIVQSVFPVSLADHNIKIPKVVYDKLAPVIQVTIAASMQLRDK